MLDEILGIWSDKICEIPCNGCDATLEISSHIRIFSIKGVEIPLFPSPENVVTCYRRFVNFVRGPTIVVVSAVGLAAFYSVVLYILDDLYIYNLLILIVFWSPRVMTWYLKVTAIVSARGVRPQLWRVWHFPLSAAPDFRHLPFKRRLSQAWWVLTHFWSKASTDSPLCRAEELDILTQNKSGPQPVRGLEPRSVHKWLTDTRRWLVDAAFKLEKQHSYRFWRYTCGSVWCFQCQCCERGVSANSLDDRAVLTADVMVAVEIRPAESAHTFYECTSSYATRL